MLTQSIKSCLQLAVTCMFLRRGFHMVYFAAFFTLGQQLTSLYRFLVGFTGSIIYGPHRILKCPKKEIYHKYLIFYNQENRIFGKKINSAFFEFLHSRGIPSRFVNWLKYSKNSIKKHPKSNVSHEGVYTSCEIVSRPVSRVAWENSHHLATPPLVSPWKEVWETSTEIPFWWRVTTQIWVVLLTGRAA